MDAGGIITGYEFNALGEIEDLIGPNGDRWRRQYDGAGRQVSLTDPLGRVIEYRYDLRGRRNAIQTPLGLTNRTFDAAGRLTRNQFFDGTTYDYTYDDNSMLLRTGGLALRRNAESQIIDSNGILSEYDAARRVRTITYARGKEVTYSYDARGRLVQVADWTGGVTRFTYDAANRRTRIERPNGVSTDFTYDENDAVASVRHSGPIVAAEVTLERDDDGQITSATFDTPLPGQPAAGARAMTYDAAHQMSNATYDALGRLTTDALRQYGWDGNSTLTGYDGGDGAAEFTYDGLGSRTSRTTAAGTNTYVLNYAHSMATVSIVRSEGVDQRYYLYEPNGRLLQSIETSDNSSTFYHFDHTGSTIMLTDNGGAMTDAYAVAPFGEDVQQQGDSDQPFVYHGAFGVMWERGTTLYNMRRRYYDAATGRFLTRDPILLLDPLGVNPYQFAFNQPLRFVDPTGLNPGFVDGGGTGPGVASNVNQLWGDWFIVDPTNNFAQGDNLVHVEAHDGLSGSTQPNLDGVNTSNNPHGYTFYGRYVGAGGLPNGQDNREPLGTSWGARYIGAFSGGTTYVAWRDSTIVDLASPQDTTSEDDSSEKVAAVPNTGAGPPGTIARGYRTVDNVNSAPFVFGDPGNDIIGGSNLCDDDELADTGEFFFLNPNNMEFLIKVLDGVGFGAFGNFWVFAAATTNVEYTLRVTDTVTGETKSYENPLGTPAPAVVDTQAFATCP